MNKLSGLALLLHFIVTPYHTFAQKPDDPQKDYPPWGDNIPIYSPLDLSPPLEPKADDPYPYPPHGDNFPVYFEQRFQNLCAFKAKVTPSHWTNRVESIYTDMCIWYHHIFKDHPIDPNIPLNAVIFVDSWDKIDYVKDSDELSGLFAHVRHKDINEVVILYPPQASYWHTDKTVWIDSIIAHEIFHYFTKSCCFELISKIEGMDISILEASAYWAQDEFIKRHSMSEDLISLIKTDRKDFRRSADFQQFAVLYSMDPKRYLYNASIWFGENPQEKFDNLVKGNYTIKRQKY